MSRTRDGIIVDPKAPPARPRVSVVIPTRDRRAFLETVLDSYLQPPVLEVVVVDDHSSDGTASFIVARSIRDERIRYVSTGQAPGTPAARNRGVAESSGEYVLFGEDDVLFAPGAIALLADCISSTRASGVTPRLVYPAVGESLDAARVRDAGVRGIRVETDTVEAVRAGASLPLQVPWGSAIVLYDRSVFDYAAFDRRYRFNAFREESDFQLQVRGAGGTLFLCPEAVAFHLPKEGVDRGGAHGLPLPLHEYWLVVNNVRFAAKNRALLDALGESPSGPLALTLRLVGERFEMHVHDRATRLRRRLADKAKGLSGHG